MARPTKSEREAHEIAHGRRLAEKCPEQTWGWDTPAGRHRARRRAELIGRAARLGPGTRALEIGCGTGNFTAAFAASGAHLLAVDISPDLIARARSRSLPTETVEFAVRSFEDCEGSFDAVIGSSILHHLDLERAIARIRDRLRPGGWMAFAEPNLLNPQVFLERRLRRLPCFWYVSPDETAFRRWPVARLLESTGFDAVQVTPIDWLHPATPRPLIRAVTALGRGLESIPGVREFSGSLLIRARRRPDPC